MSDATLKQIIARVNLDPVLVTGAVTDCCMTWHHSQVKELTAAALVVQEKLNSPTGKQQVLKVAAEALTMTTLIGSLKAQYSFNHEALAELQPTRDNAELALLKKEIITQGVQQQKLTDISGLPRTVIQDRIKAYCAV